MTITLHGFPLSANTHRVRLLLSMLGLEWRERVVDLARGEHRRAEFLALNPLGQVPVLQDGDLVLRDSHAILCYLARTYDRDHAWLPRQPSAIGRIMQWLFMDANDLHNGIGYARNHLTFGVRCDLEAAQARALAALEVLERQLSGNNWLEEGKPTLADLACYPLVSVAEQAGIALQRFPAVRAWLRRCEQLPGFVRMPRM